MAHIFLPRKPNAGFDKNTKPAWQMVPVGGSRELVLTGTSKKTIIACDEPRILQVRSTVSGNNIRLTLTGVKEGTTLIEFLPPSASRKTTLENFSLEVSVKKRKEVKVTFYYVSDNHGNGTTRSIGDINKLIARANMILAPQTNVVITRRKASSLVMPLNVNLGDVVRKLPRNSSEPASENEFDDLKKHRDGKADITLFFVHEWEHDNSPSIDNANASTYWRRGSYKKKKMIVFEDRMRNDAVTLAHEIVHALGNHGHSDNASHLNASGRTRTGIFIPKKQADKMN